MADRSFYVAQYAAIFEGNKLLLLRDADKIKGKWVFPGGHVDHIDGGAEPVKALAREIREETGLRMAAAWVFRTAIKKYIDGNWRFVVYYVCHADGKVKLGKEHDAFKWADLEAAKKLAFRDREEKEIILELIKRKGAD